MASWVDDLSALVQGSRARFVEVPLPQPGVAAGVRRLSMRLSRKSVVIFNRPGVAR